MKNVGHLTFYAASASQSRRMFNTFKQGFSTTYDIVRFTIKDLSCTDTLNKQCIYMYILYRYMQPCRCKIILYHILFGSRTKNITQPFSLYTQIYNTSFTQYKHTLRLHITQCVKLLLIEHVQVLSHHALYVTYILQLYIKQTSTKNVFFRWVEKPGKPQKG